MTISIFDLFSIGIGPSSSHTVGPMRAANSFVNDLAPATMTQIKRLQVELYGSLALTGEGHGTDRAILNGLEGQLPAEVDPEQVIPRTQKIIKDKLISLAGHYPIPFDFSEDFIFHYDQVLPEHPNGMTFTIYDGKDNILQQEIYYSVGGGFVLKAHEFNQPITPEKKVTYPFATAKELLSLCKKHHLTISELMLCNEQAWHTEPQIKQQLLAIVDAMKHCIKQGCESPHRKLPGRIGVRRRAPNLYQKLQQNKDQQPDDMMNWVNLYALAVNEENAAGGRIVTAPTNGAAGIIPAVLMYYLQFCKGANEAGIIDFLLTAGAIAILYKKGASISAAEVGCQGEVGVACSMAAGALTAVLGGSLDQIENAAEIGMEHNLGLTCDPIAGLVQIPCIERNTMGTIQAINAAKLALLEDGTHHVSLDDVIATMLQTGRDMQSRYKETSQGGLAVNYPEC